MAWNTPLHIHISVQQAMASLIVLLPGKNTRSCDTSAVAERDERNDSLDDFNHPRERRRLILKELGRGRDGVQIYFEQCSMDCEDLGEKLRDVYGRVASKGLLDFLSSAWKLWEGLGKEGQDPSGFLDANVASTMKTPPLVPSNTPLLWDTKQRPSRHVLGQVGYYCTDTCTPIFKELLEELAQDASLVQLACEKARKENTVLYVLPTHPGHHAAFDSFGGYCYVNHVAAMASRFLPSKVAILDVDYHCGNGTASIFRDEDSVLVVSIHCDPDWDYPFHSGFSDENGESLLHLPLPPGTGWNEYKTALEKGMRRITDFGAKVLIVSLGLDTHADDPCAIRRAGFRLSGDDYIEMGKSMARGAAVDTPVIFSQEGGYRMDKIGTAAADVVTAFITERSRNI